MGPAQLRQQWQTLFDTGGVMIVLGIVLLVVGFLLGIHILWTLGIILIVVGVVLVLLGSVGRPVMGRRHYW
jgi:uncharacterized membrane protein HdeD (DUF308 family)